MKALKKYIIPFSGLKLGNHQFEFEIDNTFFEAYEFSIVKTGALKVAVLLEKSESMLIFHFELNGTVDLTCDRCLAVFPANTKIKERVLVKFVEDALESDDDEIILLKRGEHEIQTADLLYEFITVNVPFYKVCTELSSGDCDQEMIKFLAATKDQQESPEQNSDPRWEALKKLKG